jgi:hypothetical protein
MNNPAVRLSSLAQVCTAQDTKAGTRVKRVPLPGRDTRDDGDDDGALPAHGVTHRKTKGEAVCQLSIAIFVVLPIVCLLVSALGAALIYKVGREPTPKPKPKPKPKPNALGGDCVPDRPLNGLLTLTHTHTLCPHPHTLSLHAG